MDVEPAWASSCEDLQELLQAVLPDVWPVRTRPLPPSSSSHGLGSTRHSEALIDVYNIIGRREKSE